MQQPPASPEEAKSRIFATRALIRQARMDAADAQRARLQAEAGLCALGEYSTVLVTTWKQLRTVLGDCKDKLKRLQEEHETQESIADAETSEAQLREELADVHAQLAKTESEQKELRLELDEAKGTLQKCKEMQQETDAVKDAENSQGKDQSTTLCQQDSSQKSISTTSTGTSHGLKGLGKGSGMMGMGNSVTGMGSGMLGMGNGIAGMGNGMLGMGNGGLTGMGNGITGMGLGLTGGPIGGMGLGLTGGPIGGMGLGLNSGLGGGFSPLGILGSSGLNSSATKQNKEPGSQSPKPSSPKLAPEVKALGSKSDKDEKSSAKVAQSPDGPEVISIHSDSDLEDDDSDPDADLGMGDGVAFSTIEEIVKWERTLEDIAKGMTDIIMTNAKDSAVRIARRSHRCNTQQSVVFRERVASIIEIAPRPEAKPPVAAFKF